MNPEKQMHPRELLSAIRKILQQGLPPSLDPSTSLIPLAKFCQQYAMTLTQDELPRMWAFSHLRHLLFAVTAAHNACHDAALARFGTLGNCVRLKKSALDLALEALEIADGLLVS